MIRLTTIMLIVLATFVLALAACGKHNNPANPGLGRLGSATAAGQRASPEIVYTEEDWQLIQMPYAERLAYLEKRFKDLVYEYHGIVIEDSLLGDKATMAASTEKGLAVCVADDDREGGENADFFNEELTASEVVEGETWSLSFLERLYADYDFNGVVAIADITPIALNFGAEYNFRSEPPEWTPENKPAAPDIDRLSSANLRIGIEDITAIAVNFGLQIRGYNVYSFPQSGTLEDSQLLAKWRRDIGNRQSQRKQPA